MLEALGRNETQIEGYALEIGEMTGPAMIGKG
jgi:hypothetical protein